MILVLDNYDSFVHNVARILRELGAPGGKDEEVRVVRSDALSVAELLELDFSHLVISPGPGTPASAGVSVAAVRALGGRVPVLGVCLGHQVVAAACGARVVRARLPLHGRSSKVHHRGEGILAGLSRPFDAGRYHSLVVDRGSLPEALEVTAVSDEGEIMALRHRRVPVFGVQFHPESVLTPDGSRVLANFLAVASPRARPGKAVGQAAGRPSARGAL